MNDGESSLGELAEAYGRSVPQRVRLREDFDLPDDCGLAVGDVLVVALPPLEDELDLCTLFVWLPAKGDAPPTKDRVYDHEVSAV